MKELILTAGIMAFAAFAMMLVPAREHVCKVTTINSHYTTVQYGRLEWEGNSTANCVIEKKVEVVS